MSVISAIDKHSVHKICSGQVVLDIATAVKELVENSIDAGATSVDVNFVDSGIGGIEVVDNGCGIDPLNYESLALKHYTSKISNFEDLEKVMTFGFRGEALSSLCALSHLTVVTATKTQAPMGVKLEYDSAGSLKSKAPQSRTAGTTLQLTDLFHSLPVRRQEFKRNIKREFGKALIILQAYSIISTNVKITVSNQTGTKPSIKIMSTSKNQKMSDNITNIFGSKLTSQIIPFNVDLGSALEGGSVEGFISKPEWGLGRSTSDRQYFYVNGRPCVLPKVAKAINDVYRIFITNQYPVVVANLKLPTDTYDVNVSPDKRTIYLHEENKISDVLQEQLKEQLEPSRSIFNVNSLMSRKEPAEEPLPLKPDARANISTSTPSAAPLPQPSPRVVSLSSFARGATKITPSNSSNSSSSKRSMSSVISSSLMNYVSKKPRVDVAAGGDDIAIAVSGQDTSMLVDASSSAASEATEMEVDELDESSEEADTDAEPSKISKSSGQEPDQFDSTTEESVPGTDLREYVPTVSNVSSFKGLWRTVGRTKTVKSIDLAALRKSQPAIITPNEAYASQSVQTSVQVLQNASVKNTDDNEKATKALSRVISKPDFARMEVLGQFNLGFMITALDDQDLYIIDQHASDEKYNFETLQQTTHIKGQRLISSPILDLTAAEELIVMDNLDIFKANGFDVEILPDNPPTTRIRVISQPVSKNTMFDKRDFSELIHLITEHPGEMVRCSRNRAMFASRACHKAARIGDSLSKNQMTKIVRHMGEIDQPWNCPHGRPTMRHLFNISQFKQEYKANASNRALQFSGTLFHTK
ncbi:MFS domain-containing protein [Mucor velutinosus]|uniref:DNA mismatch repair protein PMS1 n=1 Tax=Mucor velutinosus TaxID=708070 RepID=A0AAN7DDG9_9FUNG|nr:MFS domain-containing protein [Mucor velutinosus]